MKQFTYVLGVPNFANYEATASLIRVPRGGGEIEYVSIGEERLARTKHTYAFPLRGIHYCLQAFGLESLEEVDYIYTDYARVKRWMHSGPGYRALEHDYLKLRLKFPRERIRVVDHHDAHAASAFYPSPFEDAAVLVVDSLGSRQNTQTLYHFTPSEVKELERGDHWGIGRLYSLVTGAVLPYGPEKGFGKTMGLAPYGREHPGPVLHFDARDAGMSSDYSAFCSRPPKPRIVAEGIRRCEDREQVLDPYFARAAYDVQQECERQMVRMARYAYEQTGSRNICISGGVGLNGLANARVLEQTPFERIFIPPGCSDTGLSLGAALWGYFREIATAQSPRVTVSMPNAYTGRPYPAESIRKMLDTYGIAHRQVSPEDVAPLIASGRVIAWFEGGSEFGPRALGHRSIVADPRDPQMKDTLNHRVKFREGYRPYAPSILAEFAAEWLHLDADSPFMLLVTEVREEKRALIPAVTHVDNTTRPQTVTAEANPHYYRLIREFHRLTGVPMVLNTSLNVNREPIVETPIDALICAFGTAIDFLYLDGLLIECTPYADPALVKRLLSDRAQVLDEDWKTATGKYLTRYDAAERDAYLTEANRVTEWHRDYRSKYELEQRMAAWTSAGARIAIVGTRAHTRALYLHIDGFPDLDVNAFVPMDDRPGERGELSVYPESPLASVDWAGVDAVLVSTHEYQAQAASLVRDVAGPDVDIFTMYDDAGDSLLHVLPGQWPVINPLAEPVGRAAHAPAVSFDIESPEASRALAHRHALIISYHYCHPAGDAFLKGTKSISPEDFDRQLRTLKQNFVCTTMGELLDPAADLPETVAVVTFDDGFKDVATYALPLLQRWGIPATIYCSSAPLVEGCMLNVHRVHLLQARLGVLDFRKEFEDAVEALHPDRETRADIDVQNLYPYDDEATRRFKRLLNFEVPPHILDVVLKQLFARFIGADADAVARLYLSADDLRRLQDAGMEIGAHGHLHLVHSRLTDDEQRRELRLPAEYFRQTFGVRELHYSYPYGAIGTWNDTTKRLAEELGYASASTKVRTIVKPSDLQARWEIPRYDVRDVFDATGALVGEELFALFTSD